MSDHADAFVVGPQLLSAGQEGPLGDLTFVAKELFDVAGLPTGCGNPTCRADASPATGNAWIVETLLAAGADLIGTTITDEFAFSLSGTNVHDGTPSHPIDTSRVPGGSSAGSASAVARSAADIGIGTDTGGSIRVPASYCGIVGLRPTHGLVPTEGLAPLAPSFDTVGLMTQDVATMRAAWSACTSAIGTGDAASPSELVVADDLFDRLDPMPGVRTQLLDAANALADAAGLSVRHVALGELVGVGLDEMLDAFRALQMREIWTVHGSWITERNPAMGPGIAARFEAAAQVTDAEVEAARPVQQRVRAALHELTDDGAVIAQPAASGVAPLIDQAVDEKNAMRHRTLVLTSPAGLAGLPVLVVPGASVDGLPVGLALVGRSKGEASLIDVALATSD